MLQKASFALGARDGSRAHVQTYNFSAPPAQEESLQTEAAAEIQDAVA